MKNKVISKMKWTAIVLICEAFITISVPAEIQKPLIAVFTVFTLVVLYFETAGGIAEMEAIQGQVNATMILQTTTELRVRWAELCKVFEYIDTIPSEENVKRTFTAEEIKILKEMGIIDTDRYPNL